MKTAIERDAQAQKARLFEDLPEPSEAQVQQVRSKEADKRAQGMPRLLDVRYWGTCRSPK